MSKNKLDRTVRQTFSRGAEGDIGIEIELEGSGFKYPAETSRWCVVPEHSLRNGQEYVLRRPVPMAALDGTLDELTSFVDKATLDLSIRCSTHIHVNVSDLTIRQVYHAVFGYYLLEQLLLDACSPNRQGNLFCLRLSDAEHIGSSIVESIRGGHMFMNMDASLHRYAALNLVALRKYGSLEFRFLDPMVDKELLMNWCGLLHSLIHTCANKTPDELFQMYEDLSPKDFIRHLVKPKHAHILIQDKTNASLNRAIHTNYDLIKDFASLMSAQKFQMPKKYWDIDLIHGFVPFGSDEFDETYEHYTVDQPTPTSNPSSLTAQTWTSLMSASSSSDGL